MQNKLLKTLFVLFSLLFAVIASANQQYQLIFAADFIRHGDRTPASAVLNDSVQWKQGLGELTPKGMRQLYMIGKSLRKIYMQEEHLLPAQYTTNTMYVRSSDYNRTLMSAESLLLGLYPLGSGPKLTKQSFALPQGYQPIPIHTVNTKNDDLLTPSDVDGKQFQELLTQHVYSQPFWQAKEQENQAKLALWSKQTGYNMSQLRSVVSLGDALYIRKLSNINPPAGLNQKNVEEIINLTEWIMVNKFKPTPVAKFMTKQFWQKLKTDMENAAANNKEKPPLKYVLYLGHDTNILSIMSALGLPLSHEPPYGSDVRFELLKDEQERLWVKVSYNHIEQKLPGCESLCSMEQFFKLII